MTTTLRTFPAAFLLCLLLGGCASVDTKVERAEDLARVQRFFVIANANDSRALDRHLVNALRARGLTAEFGPRTMIPDDTQAVITYQDSWTWDFGDRLMYLEVTARDVQSRQPLGLMQYRAKIPGRQPVGEIITDLVTRLFTPAKR
ncbi:hypothetical protein Verru16b_00218 [Lacunisphaera limnophila]|uniref:DUF4136 domain-containing protein n=1 Tax=Lacunisphaera limnophila TaxID=1838286 RepID=A0A1I7PHT1_9BACT|nr:hypothetical protein [Lacunisphaera limnophila]AOS43175.1 hypothetical protein Verru16b_00218 [Lacunisphaera limnophila]